jgi:hypothetical protein
VNYKSDYWKTVPGWFDWFDLYDEVAITTPPYSTVIEVGVAFGRSLLYLAQKIKETGKQIRICAVDPWLPYEEHAFIYQESAPQVESERVCWEAAQKHGGVFPSFLHYLYESGLADMVDILRTDSVSASMVFEAKEVHPHFVFIDADHSSEENVRRDLDYWWDLHPEWISGHDYNRGSEIHFPGVWKAVHSKFGGPNGSLVDQNIEWVGQTCFVVRRANLERESERGKQAVRPFKPVKAR